MSFAYSVSHIFRLAFTGKKKV
jgi:hypothetical protein